MAKKYYAVAKGLKTGVYTTWDECKKQTSGYPGAIFKSFPTEAEAKQYVNKGKKDEKKNSVLSEYLDMPLSGLIVEFEHNKKALASVDGSYDQATSAYASGGVIIEGGKQYEFSFAGNNPKLVSMRNVAGEIEAAKYAMDYCVEKGIKELVLFYDYEGIEKWCTGAWSAKKEGTQEYVSHYNSIKSKLKVSFVKVKGHEGIELNEMADKLAKRALGIS